MRATTLAAALLTATALSACATKYDTDITDAINDLASAGVRIETKQAAGTGIGSGVYIGNGIVLTNAHVVDGASALTIKSDVGDIQPAEVLWVNAEYDVAAVRPANPRRFQAANLDCREPVVDENIRAVGNPAGIEFITMRGYVSGKVREMGHWKAAFVTDMTTVGGMSGGPIYDADGDVIGLTAGVYSTSGPDGGMGFAVPASALCMLLGRA